MSRCPKCGKIVEFPIKIWKIKQISIANFNCLSCKTKWKKKVSIDESKFPLTLKDVQGNQMMTSSSITRV